MSIGKLSNVLPPIRNLSTEELKGPQKSNDGHFDNIIYDKIKDVNNDVVHANKMSEEFLTEGKHSLHEVMISLEKAELSFKYMQEIRNKVLEAYTEVMRTPV